MQKASISFMIKQPVRLSFPQLFEPKPVMMQGQPTGDPRYSSLLVLDPVEQAEAVKQIVDAQKKIVATAFPDGVPPNFHWAMRKGEAVRPDDPNLKGKLVMSANARQDSPPEVVQRDPITLKTVPLRDRRYIFSGAECYVHIGLFAYRKSATSVGIGCGLNTVLPTGRDVGRFDGRVDAAHAFAEVPTDVGILTDAGPMGGAAATTGGNGADPMAGLDDMPGAGGGGGPEAGSDDEYDIPM